MPSVNFFLMNPLNWLSFISESRSEGESFDTSMVLPLTVGLGTVVVSVLLGIKSNLLNNNSNRKLPQDQNVASSIREGIRRKPSKPSTRSKLNISSAGELQPTPNTYTAVHETASFESVSTPVVSPVDTPKAPESFPLHPDLTSSNANTFLGTINETSTPSLFQPTPHSASEVSKSSGARKKSKKSKRSHRSDESQITSSKGLLTETDPSWVTVIPKKSKHPIGVSPQDTSTTPAGHPVSCALNNAKQEENEGLLPVFPSTVVSCPSTSECLSLPNTTTQPITVESALNRVTQPVTFVERPPNSSVPAADRPSTPQPTATSDRITNDDDCNCEPRPSKFENERSSTSTDPTPIDPHSQETSSSFAKETPSTLKPLALFAHLPATSQLLAQHLSAQVQAKEAECQLLRSEVIYLRDQVERALGASKSRCVDVDTMTDVNEPEVESTSAPDESEPTVPDILEHRSDSPDTVLLRTLQNEIARLAKEVTLSHQRNENLEARLNTTKSQLAVAKKKTSRDTKSIRQQLELETERATTAEQTAQELEAKLQEALQQLATQRQQLEEGELASSQKLERARLTYTDLLTQKERWEQQQTVLQNEKDRLLREYETLRTKHNACIVDLDNARYESDNLRTMLRDTESRLDTLKRDHAAALIETQTHATQLEAQLVANQDKHLDTQSRLSAAESSIIRLTTELDAALTRLTSVTGELNASRAACLALEQRVLNEQDSLQRTRSVEAETIQTHPNSRTTPFLAEACTFLDETTQTDSEPAVEFEMLSTAEHSTQPVAHCEPHDKFKELESQVVHYKSALDMAETMLSKLQASVEEEEQRWRGALHSSTVECELLRSNILKLESSVSGLIEERDQLTETLNKLRHQRSPIRTDVDSHSTDGCESRAHCLSVTELIDKAVYDENTPKTELLCLLNRFRYLVQVEHDALIHEQINGATLQTQLHSVSLNDDNGAPCDDSRDKHSHALDAPTKWSANGLHKLVPAGTPEPSEVIVDGDVSDNTVTLSSNGQSHETNPSEPVVYTAPSTSLSNGLHPP